MNYSISYLKIDHDKNIDEACIYIYSGYISRKGDKLKRNELVEIKNLSNGTIVHAPVRSLNTIKANQTLMSYELACQLNIENVSEAFREAGRANGIGVNLRVNKVSAIVYLKESVLSGNKVSRIISALGVLSVVDTLISIIGHLFNGLHYVLSILSSLVL